MDFMDTTDAEGKPEKIPSNLQIDLNPLGQSVPECDEIKQDASKGIEAVDGGWGWIVVFGSSMCHFFLIGIARSLGIIFILLRDKFQATAAQTALVTAIFICIRSGGGPVASLLSDRFSCRKVAAAGGLLLFVGIVSSAFASNLILVYLTFGVIAGIGAMMVYTPCYIIVGYWFDKHRGMAMSLSTIGTGLGSIVMAYVMTAMSSEYQYFGSILIVGALMLHNTVGALLFLNPPTPKINLQQANNNDGEFADIELKESADNCAKREYEDKNVSNSSHDVEQATVQTERPHSTSYTSVRSPVRTAKSCFSSCLKCSLWKNVPFMIHCCMMIGQQGCIQCVLLFLPSYARLELHCGPLQEAWILAVFGIADLLGRFIFGFLFDVSRIRPHRVSAYILVSLLFALFATSTALTTNYPSLIVITAFTAMFQGGAHSQRATVIPNYVQPSQMSLGVGLVFLFMGIGNFYGPVAGGKLSDYTGTFRSSFILSGCIYLLICTVNIFSRLYYWWRRRQTAS